MTVPSYLIADSSKELNEAFNLFCAACGFLVEATYPSTIEYTIAGHGKEGHSYYVIGERSGQRYDIPHV